MNQGMKQLARRLETEPAVLVTILESSCLLYTSDAADD